MREAIDQLADAIRKLAQHWGYQNYLKWCEMTDANPVSFEEWKK